MDGTIINSIAAAERVWGDWARSKGLDVAAFMPTMHGSRGVDTIGRLNLPGVDPVAESLLITEAEIADVEGVVPLPGAIEFLASLPPERWAIVTSSPYRLAQARLAAAGVPVPRFIVTAEDVKIGKARSAMLHSRCRAPRSSAIRVAWIFRRRDGRHQGQVAAGADVMVITATHSHPIETGSFDAAEL